jgi:3-deoxy-D-manno-octulosonate 8-phosphate phosphatase (KDO 8-P phosphatase)
MSAPVYSLLKEIRAFVFDVDGVMTDGSLLITEEGNLLRTFHIRDGYALRRLILSGYHLAVISGGRSAGVIKRLQDLGVSDIFMDAQEKEDVLQNWMKRKDIRGSGLAYMGDDLLDIPAMNLAALKACPADAVSEIKNIANYISPVKGGAGCVRDLIELVLKVQNQW